MIGTWRSGLTDARTCRSRRESERVPKRPTEAVALLGLLLLAGASCIGDDGAPQRTSDSSASSVGEVEPVDVDATTPPDGRIATLTFRLRHIPEIDPDLVVRDEDIVLVSRDGEVVERASITEMLLAGPKVFSFQKVDPYTQEKDGKKVVDHLHSNSVEWVRGDSALDGRNGLFAPGRVLISMRHQDSIVLLDWKTKRVVWSWGRGELSGPHDATLLDNGNVLLFDNGLGRGWSRVLELDPVQRRVVWQHSADEPESFYSMSRGSNQRLPNGNTLITSSDQGHAFEITPRGERVWEFSSAPERGDIPIIVRTKRYPVDFIESILRSQGERLR